MMATMHIRVSGVVQGVGFRPFVYGLAKRLGLHGWVRNTSGGVEILVEGHRLQVESFIHSLQADAPPLAKIDSITVKPETPDINLSTFDIRPSTHAEGTYQPISPDTAICSDCERELFDPSDHRYLYPFINCTNCGPRFTIITDIPYDRPSTTMADFPLCDDCRAEYENPLDRRFHAQPVACPKCGPFVTLRETRARFAESDPKISTIEYRLSAILKARRFLREGRILAVKGLGGFHLACDADNAYAVDELRRRKGRVGKPFALMAADLDVVKEICHVSGEERGLLTGHEKPIVLLEKRRGAGYSSVAPDMDTLGFMLPYTPLHHLLLNQTNPILAREPAPAVLVMTSGNLSEEPIATDNEEALERLSSLADAFLLHNRPIHIRCDDSVLRVESRRRCPEPVEGSKVGEPSTFDLRPSTVFLRRSRGYAPYPVQLPFKVKSSLALGGELKNTFCLARDGYAFLSHHIGDMENAETYESFEQGVAHLSHIFRVQPELIAYDLHPNYFTTHYAQKQNVPQIAVQHHHAHIASCMADNGLEDRRVIGLSFDGTGYGTDGAIWGGEVLLASYADFERIAHLEYLPLPGGDSAIRHPWRIALGYAHVLGLNIADLPFLQKMDKQAITIVQQQVDKKLNAPLTSSMGRLFDAVASLSGVRSDVTYEAQAAIEMEVLSKPFIASAETYPCHSERSEESPLIIRVKDLFAAIIHDIRAGESVGMIGAKLHKTIATKPANEPD
ncbi:MAG TPA: carbamoyltransferase HypF [Anaerolineales bacterium]|nr:carbamoyltransferase HypF [Anaerolineales bacterium]